METYSIIYLRKPEMAKEVNVNVKHSGINSRVFFYVLCSKITFKKKFRSAKIQFLSSVGNVFLRNIDATPFLKQSFLWLTCF